MPRTDITVPPPGIFNPNCWGLGKPFGGGPTPSVISVTVRDIAITPLWVPADGNPPTGNYTLQQASATSWTFDDFRTKVTLSLRDDISLLRILRNFNLAFVGEFGQVCIITYDNGLDPLTNKFAGGFADLNI